MSVLDAAMKDQMQKQVDELHLTIQEALTRFTDRTGLKITSTKWDCGEVLRQEAGKPEIVVKYMRLRSQMETRVL